MAAQPGRVVLIAGPIGNLEDITIRALSCLGSCDAIACEDTRHSGRLLSRHEIPRKPLLSLHEHNEEARSQEIVARVDAGEVVAVLTDAGMPTVSDPGYRLVQACIKANVRIEVLPGPSAVLTALAGSGLGTDSFYFGGFLPQKSGRRRKELEKALERECSSIYFESPYRILKSIAVVGEIEPGRNLCVARELTKKFETFHRGNAAELTAEFESRPPKGELTFLIGGKPRRRRKQYHIAGEIG